MSAVASMLEQTAQRLFSDHSTPSVVAEAETGLWPDALWEHLSETGLTAMLVPEESGGAGGSWLDAGIVLQLAGRHSAPVPLAETLLASLALARTGITIPDGPLTIAPIHPDDALEIRRAQGGWHISGVARRVPWGLAAGRIVVLGGGEGTSVIALVDPARCEVSPGTNLAGEPRDMLTFDRVFVSDAAAGPAPAGIDLDWLHARGALMRTVQMTGALESILDISLEYAQVRTQFGQPIGHFQAIQHQLVQLAGDVAAARAATDLALAAEEQDATFAIAAAKALVSAVAGPAAAIAHQVHGAIGFTQEHRLQLNTRRLWSWRDEFSSETYWAARLGRMTLEAGADAFWPALTAVHQPEED